MSIFEHILARKLISINALSVSRMHVHKKKHQTQTQFFRLLIMPGQYEYTVLKLWVLPEAFSSD